MPQGVLNATPFFQSAFDKDVLDGLVGTVREVWVDAIVIKGGGFFRQAASATSTPGL